MANTTQHYHLNQWVASDAFLRTDFNEDNAKIDAALKSIQQGAGNCRLVTGSYVGTGTYGSGNPVQLTFDANPAALFVGGGRSFFALRPPAGTASVHVSSFGSGGGTPYEVYLSWGNKSVQWYGNNTAEVALNAEGVTYYYLALVAL